MIHGSKRPPVVIEGTLPPSNEFASVGTMSLDQLREIYKRNHRSMKRAATELGYKPNMVSMVLTGQARSSDLLFGLRAFAARLLREEQEELRRLEAAAAKRRRSA